MNEEENVNLTIQTYNAIANEYAKDFFNNKKDKAFVYEFTKTLSKGMVKILDAGCGPGNLTKVFVDFGFDVTGIDLSDTMLKIARAMVSGATFEKLDIRKTGFQEAMFDGIFAGRVLFHIPPKNLLPTLTEFKRILKPSGKLGIMMSVVPKSYDGIEKEVYNPNLNIYYSHYSLEDIKKTLNEAGFKSLKFKTEKHRDEDSGKIITRLYLTAQN